MRVLPHSTSLSLTPSRRRDWLATGADRAANPHSGAAALLVIVPVTLFLTAGCDAGPEASTTNAPVVPQTVLKVNVIEARRDPNALKTVVSFGELIPRRQSRLGFARGGRVRDAYVQLGEAVTAGTKLADLQQDDLEDQRQSLEQAVQQARTAAESGSSAAPATALRERVQRLQEQLQEVTRELANGVILAPYDCIIAERNVEAGSSVSPAVAAFQVVEDSPPLVETRLSGPGAAQLSTDQTVAVRVSDRVVRARLQARSPLQDAAAGRRIRLEFVEDLDSATWSLGQGAEIRFQVSSGESGFWLPVSALQRTASGLWSVYVAGPRDNADVAVGRRMVEILRLEGDSALVSGSLDAGEAVIVEGTHRIVPGQLVERVDVSDRFPPPFRPGVAE